MKPSCDLRLQRGGQAGDLDELELAGLADDVERAARVTHAGKLHQDRLVVVLQLHRGLGDAQTVDAGVHDDQRALHRDRVGRLLRREDDRQPAAQVEAPA